MGRTARHVQGSVILYADTVTRSMKAAIEEIQRRRDYQLEYNIKHSITPISIAKPIRQNVVNLDEIEGLPWQQITSSATSAALKLDSRSLTPQDREKWIKRLERDMRSLAKDMNFEAAIEVRDKLRELKDNHE
jgi:excinuclease ABC subunit B